MRDDGDIRHLDEEEAKQKGYKEMLTYEEAEILLKIPKDERTRALKYIRKHQSLWAQYFNRDKKEDV